MGMKPTYFGLQFFHLLLPSVVVVVCREIFSITLFVHLMPIIPVNIHLIIFIDINSAKQALKPILYIERERERNEILWNYENKTKQKLKLVWPIWCWHSVCVCFKMKFFVNGAWLLETNQICTFTLESCEWEGKNKKDANKIFVITHRHKTEYFPFTHRPRVQIKLLFILMLTIID